MNIFFTPSVVDLQNIDDRLANQRGEITDAQNARLTASLGFQQGCVILLFIVLFLPFMIGLGVMVFSSWGQSETIFVLFLLLFFMLVFGATFLGGIFSLWKVWSRWQLLKRDRENRSIRQGQGQLAFGKSGYQVFVDGRELHLPLSSNAGGLKPGATYRFFYLDESGFVLSAEELFPASPSQARNALLEILATANKFSQEDLTANQNGETTSSQRLKALPGMFGGVLLGLFPLGLGLVIFYTNQDSGDLTPLLVPVIFLAIFAIFGGFLFFNGLLDFLVQSPLVVEGVGHKEKRVSRGRRNRNTTYYYVVDGVSFRVRKSAFDALIDGERYRVYALPRTKQLLTIEPLYDVRG